MQRIFRKTRIVSQKPALNSAELGGLFIVNVIGLGFFFSIASISTPFFFLYLAYVLNTGVHIYDRGLKGTYGDLRAFFHKILPI